MTSYVSPSPAKRGQLVEGLPRCDRAHVHAAPFPDSRLTQDFQGQRGLAWHEVNRQLLPSARRIRYAMLFT